MQETHVSFIPTTSQEVIRQGTIDADARGNHDHKSSRSKFSNWVVSNPKKVLASILSLAAAGVGTYFLARESNLPGSAASSAITDRNISPSFAKLRKLRMLPNHGLATPTIEFMTKSVSQLPASVIAPPITTPDWYKALTSTAQPSSESLQLSTHDSAVSLPDPPLQTTPMAPDSQLPTELPMLSTITPSALSNNHQKTPLPTSITELPLTTPDWHKALVSTAQLSSESLQPSTHDLLPGLPSQTTTLAPDSQLPTERPALSTITPSTVSNSDQKTTVATPEKKTAGPIVKRPYAEFEPAGYLAFSDTDFRGRVYGESREIKKKIVSNLPRDVQLIVYTSGNPELTRKTFQPSFGDMKRFHVLKVKDSSATRYWARDSLPIPVYGKNGSLILVDSKYHQDFEPDRVIANFFNTTLLSHPYEFEGGNLLADSKGNCFTVNNFSMRWQQGFNDDVFKKYFGCKRLTRLKNKTHVGHVDEVIKIIDDKNIITDRRGYRSILRRLGYKVTMMPRAKGRHASYLNSVIVNGKVFVPVYGNKKTDKRALDIYRSFGLRAYKFKSNRISARWMGSIHCSMVTYPKIGNNKPSGIS